MSDRYIKHPGGVILHEKDGAAEYYGYGAKVDEDKLADYQLTTLDKFTDDNPRSDYVQSQVAHQAAVNAIHADAGQVNSTSDPVPGNYGELTEEEAAQLMLALQAEPNIQARLLTHERIYQGGRQQVVDAASPLARAIADTLVGHVEEGAAVFDQTRALDQERQAERNARQQARSRSRSSSKKGDGEGDVTPPPNE